MTRSLARLRGTREAIPARGFSLIELMVAVAIFLIVSATSFTLFSRHQALLSEQQGLAGLNIGLRNALTQIQVDLINAGNGITPVLGPYVPAWPVGVTINNQAPDTACNVASTFTYTATCFDTLNVILADSQTPAWRPESDLSSSPVNTSTQTTLYAVPAGSYTASQYASNFKAGDTLLLVSASGSSFTTVNLTADGSAYPAGAPTVIQLNYTSTSSAGVNPNDGFMVTTSASASNLSVSYSTSDWLIRLAPITYSVDAATDPNNPKLNRQLANGASIVVMEQVIGFRVGAAVFGDATNNYYFKASAASPDGYNNDFTQVRSVRVSLIGRTKPNPTNSYRNQFDQGPYQVLANSIIVDPRNLSMDDQ